jgi:hypothetical protein
MSLYPHKNENDGSNVPIPSKRPSDSSGTAWQNIHRFGHAASPGVWVDRNFLVRRWKLVFDRGEVCTNHLPNYTCGCFQDKRKRP